MSGRYESRYLRVVDPGAPRGAWIRHTVLQRPGGAPAGSLWCTLWDAGAGPPVTVKATPALALPDGDGLRTGAARFAPGRVTAAIAAGPQRAAWDLAVHDAEPPLRHLPGPLYRAPCRARSSRARRRWRGCPGRSRRAGGGSRPTAGPA